MPITDWKKTSDCAAIIPFFCFRRTSTAFLCFVNCIGVVSCLLLLVSESPGWGRRIILEISKVYLELYDFGYLCFSWKPFCKYPSKKDLSQKENGIKSFFIEFLPPTGGEQSWRRISVEFSPQKKDDIYLSASLISPTQCWKPWQRPCSKLLQKNKTEVWSISWFFARNRLICNQK